MPKAKCEVCGAEIDDYLSIKCEKCGQTFCSVDCEDQHECSGDLTKLFDKVSN